MVHLVMYVFVVVKQVIILINGYYEVAQATSDPPKQSGSSILECASNDDVS